MTLTVIILVIASLAHAATNSEQNERIERLEKALEKINPRTWEDAPESENNTFLTAIVIGLVLIGLIALVT